MRARGLRGRGALDGAAHAGEELVRFGPECYGWLGKTLAVVTDGAFGEEGCPELQSAAARECAAGADSMDEALVTFS